MKGTLHKTDKGWVVNYRDNGIRDGMSLNYHKAAQYPLHPDETNMDVLNPSPEGKEVEFETIDYSQSCKECGETVERGRSCSKGCFMKPGNFVATGKLEYARILESKEPLSILELNNLYGDILLEYSKYLEDHGFLDTDWRHEANGENTVEDFINSKKK